MTAYLAKTNLFVGGPPGTGKTALAKAAGTAFEMKNFYYLMGADTTADELLGSLDLDALSRNEWLRDLTNGIADAELVILDEGFKANSPCLNKFLGLALDGEVSNGKQRVKAPLVCMTVCSNELPQESNLAPFWDRLALRIWVEDVNLKARKELMMREAGLKSKPTITQQITLQELSLMQVEASQVIWTEEMIGLVLEIKKRLSDHQIKISTRKSVQLIKLVGAYAYVCGFNRVEEQHLEVLQYIFWNEPSQRATIATEIKTVIEAAGNAIDLLRDSVQAILDTVKSADQGNYSRYRLLLLSADSKLLEIINEVRSLRDMSIPNSKKFNLAAEIMLDIEAARKDQILEPLAAFEYE